MKRFRQKKGNLVNVHDVSGRIPLFQSRMGFWAMPGDASTNFFAATLHPAQ